MLQFKKGRSSRPNILFDDRNCPQIADISYTGRTAMTSLISRVTYVAFNGNMLCQCTIYKRSGIYCMVFISHSLTHCRIEMKIVSRYAAGPNSELS